LARRRFKLDSLVPYNSGYEEVKVNAKELGFALHVVNVLTTSYDPGLFQHTSLHADVVGRGTPVGESGAARVRCEWAPQRGRQEHPCPRRSLTGPEARVPIRASPPG